MILLQGLQRLFIALDGGLKLADVLRTTFAEGSLGLPIALLPFLRGRIDLERGLVNLKKKKLKQN
jgi:hypothetical protein